MKHVCSIAAACSFALTLALCPPALAEVQGEDWPNYLGPNRSGVSDETGFVKTWPDDEPPVLWRREIGLGFASMAAVGDVVYAVGNTGGDEETLFALDAETGEERWTYRYPSELVDNMHEGGAAATPTVHDGRVYVHSRAGVIHCVDADTGEREWTLDVAGALELDLPDWGFASSVVIDQGVAYVQAGATVAIDAASGSINWTSDKHDVVYSSPQPFTYGGDRYVAVHSGRAVRVLNAADGSEVAAFPWRVQYDAAGPSPLILSGDRILMASGYGVGAVLLTFDGDSLEPRYRHRSLAPQMDTPVHHEGYIYGHDGNGPRRAVVDLICMDADTGDVMWRHNGFGTGAVILADDTLIIMSDDGVLATAEATPEGYRELSRGRLFEARCWTKPALAHGRLFVRSAAGELVCVDLRP